MKASIAIDMDNVIADLDLQCVRWYYRKYGKQLKKEDLYDNGHIEKEAYNFLLTPGFFSDIPVMAGAQNAILEIMKSFEVYIVSAAMEFPQSMPEKLAWLKTHFPFISWKQIIFCGVKKLIATDYMIDDYAKNLDFFNGKGIMFAAGHNSGDKRKNKVYNWDEALAYLKSESLSTNNNSRP